MLFSNVKIVSHFRNVQFFSLFFLFHFYKIISIRDVHRRKLHTFYPMHYTLFQIKLDAIHLVLILAVLCALKQIPMPKVLLELKY